MATAVRPQPPPVAVGHPEPAAAPVEGTTQTHTNVAQDVNSPISPKPRNEKAEAFAGAQRQRVEAECNAYLLSETRKAEARAATAQSKVEQKRVRDANRAVEHRKKEELKADQIVHNAELKAQKVIANAKDEAVRMKAHANEECEKLIADAHAQSEREKAALEQSKKNELSELTDRVESMKAGGEFPIVAKKGMIGRMKDKVSVHH